MVSRNGWVRKFYEALKIMSDEGVIERMFITGISPLTIDSMTSGFNIASNVTTKRLLNEMCGFTEEEVTGLLKQINVDDDKLDKIMQDLKIVVQWVICLMRMLTTKYITLLWYCILLNIIK